MHHRQEFWDHDTIFATHLQKAWHHVVILDAVSRLKSHDGICRTDMTGNAVKVPWWRRGAFTSSHSRMLHDKMWNTAWGHMRVCSVLYMRVASCISSIVNFSRVGLFKSSKWMDLGLESSTKVCSVVNTPQRASRGSSTHTHTHTHTPTKSG